MPGAVLWHSCWSCGGTGLRGLPRMTVNWDYGARWHTSHHKWHNMECWKHLNNVTTTWGEKADSGFFGGGEEGGILLWHSRAWSLRDSLKRPLCKSLAVNWALCGVRPGPLTFQSPGQPTPGRCWSVKRSARPRPANSAASDRVQKATERRTWGRLQGPRWRLVLSVEDKSFGQGPDEHPRGRVTSKNVVENVSSEYILLFPRFVPWMLFLGLREHTMKSLIWAKKNNISIMDGHCCDFNTSVNKSAISIISFRKLWK